MEIEKIFKIVSLFFSLPAVGYIIQYLQKKYTYSIQEVKEEREFFNTINSELAKEILEEEAREFFYYKKMGRNLNELQIKDLLIFKEKHKAIFTWKSIKIIINYFNFSSNNGVCIKISKTDKFIGWFLTITGIIFTIIGWYGLVFLTILKNYNYQNVIINCLLFLFSFLMGVYILLKQIPFYEAIRIQKRIEKKQEL